MDSLPGVVWHLRDAWQRQHEPNIVLTHYSDLCADLAAQMRRLAAMLDIDVPDDAWAPLVEAATFTHMRAHADRLVPDPSGVLKNPRDFFREGRTGTGRDLLTNQELARYHTRMAKLAAPPDLLTWLHR